MLSNTRHGYGLIAIALHWLMVIGIFGMFGLGLYMVELTYYDSWYHGSLETHKAIGVLVFLLLLGRFVWRQFNAVPAGLSSRKVENLAAHWAHIALYVVMAALFISGYLISTADGRSVNVFDLFSVPATLAQRGSQEEIAGTVHTVLAWLLIGMAGLHALAALKHHFINRDNTLKRMLKPAR
ncbi:cytochrome b [Oceanobacter mangrovi]|uniref:cytochrome b n=1 Tax=Oceanobacter mangrovi TaxID=2862510 RepID=UPI001C8D92CE|nr:cytochrome b [Oceanobacter mangrovi]